MVPAIFVGGIITLAAGIIGFFVGHPGGGFNVSLNIMMLLAIMGLLQLSIPVVFCKGFQVRSRGDIGARCYALSSIPCGRGCSLARFQKVQHS